MHLYSVAETDADKDGCDTDEYEIIASPTKEQSLWIVASKLKPSQNQIDLLYAKNLIRRKIRILQIFRVLFF